MWQDRVFSCIDPRTLYTREKQKELLHSVDNIIQQQRDRLELFLEALENDKKDHPIQALIYPIIAKKKYHREWEDINLLRNLFSSAGVAFGEMEGYAEKFDNGTVTEADMGEVAHVFEMLGESVREIAKLRFSVWDFALDDVVPVVREKDRKRRSEKIWTYVNEELDKRYEKIKEEKELDYLPGYVGQILYDYHQWMDMVISATKRMSPSDTEKKKELFHEIWNEVQKKKDGRWLNEAMLLWCSELHKEGDLQKFIWRL